jgi:hypothetical protein
MRQHNVRLSPEFLADIRSNGYTVPQLDFTTLRRCSQKATALLFV